MSSETERLTRERKTTVKTYTNNRTHTICAKKRGTNDFYVIWVKLIDLQKPLFRWNLCYAAMKKIKSYCKKNILLKNKSKNTKEKYINGSVIIKVCMFAKILLIN